MLPPRGRPQKDRSTPYIHARHVWMQQNLTALERAFELANSGSCQNVADIKKALKSEGYSDQQITGRTLGKQLTEMIREARVRGKRL